MPDRPNAPPRAWQRMLSGRRLDLLDPSPLDIEIADIARGLARVARWNGQTEGAHPFSVAQHSLLVEQVAGIASPALDATARLAVFLHDAPEYVIGDLISPFKALLGGEYKTIEARRFFGNPRGIDADALDLVPWPAALAEERFLARFAALADAASA